MLTVCSSSSSEMDCAHLAELPHLTEHLLTLCSLYTPMSTCSPYAAPAARRALVHPPELHTPMRTCFPCAPPAAQRAPAYTAKVSDLEEHLLVLRSFHSSQSTHLHCMQPQHPRARTYCTQPLQIRVPAFLAQLPHLDEYLPILHSSCTSKSTHLPCAASTPQ